MGVSYRGDYYILSGGLALVLTDAVWQGQGVELGKASEMPVAAMGAQIVGLFLMSWFVGVTAVSSALFTVILATIAFTVLAYSSGLFGKKSSYARNVDAGYWIVCLIIMVLCQGVGRSLTGAS